MSTTHSTTVVVLKYYISLIQTVNVLYGLYGPLWYLCKATVNTHSALDLLMLEINVRMEQKVRSCYRKRLGFCGCEEVLGLLSLL